MDATLPVSVKGINHLTRPCNRMVHGIRVLDAVADLRTVCPLGPVWIKHEASSTS